MQYDLVGTDYWVSMESGTRDIVVAEKVQAVSGALGKTIALMERVFDVWPDSVLD